MTLSTPYLCECLVGGNVYENVEVTKLNDHTCWVRFLEPEGVFDKAKSLVMGDKRPEKLIKRHILKHNVKLSYIDVTR